MHILTQVGNKVARNVDLHALLDVQRVRMQEPYRDEYGPSPFRVLGLSGLQQSDRTQERSSAKINAVEK